MIQFDTVCKRYDNGHDALIDLSFTLNPGEMTFLTGRSGAGKSTLLKLVTAIERPTSGSVVVGGQNLNRCKGDAIAMHRRNVGVVFQNHQLLFDRTVFENVALPLTISGYGEQEMARRVRAALGKVGLSSKENLNPRLLSGGEQQRVGIARAVVNKPSLLLADEPTGNLDPELSAEIMDLFKQFAQVGVSVLIATHDLSLIARYKHAMLKLDNGRLVNDDAN